MVLVDAIYINNSGGKILLDYLIEQLEMTDLNVCYLLDKRVQENHPLIKSTNRIFFLKGGLIPKHRFYRDHGNEFTKILCFANFPPDIKLKAKVFTYFHQLLFIQAPAELSFYARVLIKLKTLVFSYSASNSNFWLVQSMQVKSELCKKYRQISEKQVGVLPFYPPLTIQACIVRQKNKFVYVSTGHLYKNHERLLRAFMIFFNKHGVGELHFTVGNEFIDLHNRITSLQASGYPIFDHGFVDRKTLAEIYQSSEFVIYPSMAESFGLGIIEAIENGCRVIASDLPWLHAVCEPSCVFDPKSVTSISEAIEKAVFEELVPARQLVFNEIMHIIDLLK